MVAGDELIVLEKFDAALVLDVIERHRVTTMTATPTMLQRIADRPDVDDRDLSSVVWLLQGAAAIGPALVRRWIDLIGAERLFMAYGMTEGLGSCSLRADEWLARPGSVGRGYRGTEVRIVGDDGAPLGPDEIGDIYLRSPGAGLYKYLGAADRLVTTDDGFATAGDLGWVDADGYLFMADRRVDMVVTGGANVFPAEVESALIEHPGIADVVVIGLADPEWGRTCPRHRAGRRPRGAADGRRRDRLRQEPPRVLQGPQDRRVHRRDPPQRGHQGEPRRARGRARRLKNYVLVSREP